MEAPDHKFGLHIGAGGANYGIYDWKKNNWLLCWYYRENDANSRNDLIINTRATLNSGLYAYGNLYFTNTTNGIYINNSTRLSSLISFNGTNLWVGATGNGENLFSVNIGSPDYSGALTILSTGWNGDPNNQTTPGAANSTIFAAVPRITGYNNNKATFAHDLYKVLHENNYFDIITKLKNSIYISSDNAYTGVTKNANGITISHNGALSITRNTADGGILLYGPGNTNCDSIYGRFKISRISTGTSTGISTFNKIGATSLELGNSTDEITTKGHSKGYLFLYDNKYYGCLLAGRDSSGNGSVLTDNREYYLPDKSGTIALLSDFSGSRSVGEHDADLITYNGFWFYNLNGPGTKANLTQVGLQPPVDGALYSQAYSNDWVGQIAQDYRTGGLWVRGKNNGNWQNWLGILSSKKSNDYYGIVNPEGSDAGWIRSTQSGFIPYSSNSNGVGSLGMSDWPWQEAHIKTVYGSLNGNADTATQLTNFVSCSSSPGTTGLIDANQIGNEGLNGFYYYQQNGPAAGKYNAGAWTNDGFLINHIYNPATSVDGTETYHWVAQIAQDYRDGQLFVRSCCGTDQTQQGVSIAKGWKPWRAIPMMALGTEGLGTTINPIYIDKSDGLIKACQYPSSGSWFKGIPYIGPDGVMEIGKYIDFHSTDNTTSDYDVRITAIEDELSLSGAIENGAIAVTDNFLRSLYDLCGNGATPLFDDPTFLTGLCGITKYDNNNNLGTHVTIDRNSYSNFGISDPKTFSSNVIRIRSTGNASNHGSPGYGGFYQTIQSAEGKVFLQVFRALIPQGYWVQHQSNPMGANNTWTDTFLTSRAGTGQWQWYVRKIKCGTGTTSDFSTGGHVNLTDHNREGSGTAAADDYTKQPTWYISYCNAFEITENDKNYDKLYLKLLLNANNFSTLKTTTYGNTVTIGSQNTSYTHIYNSANIPFIFNRSVMTTSGDLGSTSWRWGTIYGTTLNLSGNATITGVITQGSDKNIKHDINIISNKYNKFYEALQPKQFKYNYDETNRNRFGFIAQEVEEAYKQAELDYIQDAIIQKHEPNENGEWDLNMIDIIPLNTWQIQQMKQEIELLKQELAELRKLVNK